MEQADLLLYNAKVYVSDEKQTVAEAVAVRDDTILCVGSMAACEAYAGTDTRRVDAGGRVVLPGLIDGHTHPETIAKSRWRVMLPEVETAEELLVWIRDYCRAHPVEELPYFYGESYPTTMFGEEGPRRELLDQYVSDRPVRLQDFTDHGCWCNSVALEKMGFQDCKCAPDTSPLFLRDEHLELTGVVREPLLCMDPYEEKMFEAIGWRPPIDITEETLTPFLNQLNDSGVIALFDGFTEGEESIRVYHDLDKSGKLHMYYNGSCLLEDFDHLDDCIRTLREWQETYQSEHVRIHAVKFFLDGTNELGSGASLEPMRNDPSGENYGTLNMTEDELYQVLLRLNQEKLDLHIHVVCDRGFRVACNAYERAKKETERSGGSWDIFMELAHCELVHPDDMPRPAALGININFSCHWAGGYFGDAAIEYLGRERWDTMYDFTTMIASGASVSYSSDVIGMCEEQRGNPYFGMETAVRRVDLESPLDPELYPGSVRAPEHAKLDLPELIRGYTRCGAYQQRLDRWIGIIEAGKRADLVVLDKDIFHIPETEIHTIDPVLVLFDGQPIKNRLY